jgi:hypothetical protein
VEGVVKGTTPGFMLLGTVKGEGGVVAGKNPPAPPFVGNIGTCGRAEGLYSPEF